MEKIYDVIIVGAGPGGSSMATFLGRQGVSALILDKATFPRDKVCGDGLVPQAIYWMDKLGCVDEVLDHCNSCIRTGDVYVNGKYIMTGTFPQDSQYPGFTTLLDRRTLDNILLKNAISHGAVFEPNCHVKKLHWEKDCITVEAESDKKSVQFKGKLVIGADGANSIVSRSIGNVLRDGTTAISVRAYYKDVQIDGSQIRIYFDERFYPGYAWVFVDDAGKANIGLGYASDNNFQTKNNLRKVFDEFIQTDLRHMLRNATPVGQTAGWWASFFKPKSMTAERVMLIGDAANLTDPLNGGGIHMAMESAYAAHSVVLQALASEDYSAESMGRYEKLWNESKELDWRTAEIIATIAKNPNLKEIYLYSLNMISKLAKEDPNLQNFCGGIFSGILPASSCLSPVKLLSAAPLNPETWLNILRSSDGITFSNLLNQAIAGIQSTVKVSGRIISDPLPNLGWGIETMNRTVGLMDCYLKEQFQLQRKANTQAVN